MGENDQRGENDLYKAYEAALVGMIEYFGPTTRQLRARVRGLEAELDKLQERNRRERVSSA